MSDEQSFDTSGKYNKYDNKAHNRYEWVLAQTNFISSGVAFIIILYTFLYTVIQCIYSVIALFQVHEAKHSLIYEPHFSSTIFEIIELLFLSSIPILITSSFYKYYKNVLRNIFMPQDKSKSMIMIDILKSSIDVSTTKYNFFSILASTGFIILLKRFNESKTLDSNEIILYFLLLMGITVLLLFTIRIKHTITETTFKVIKEESYIIQKEEQEKFNKQMDEYENYKKENRVDDNKVEDDFDGSDLS